MLAVAALAALPAASAAQKPEPDPRPEPKTNLADVSDEVMCLVCGVPLDHALENPQAQQERDFIRRLIAQGKTKDEIKDALVVQYGENVLAQPGNEGFDLAAWLVPGVALLLAVGGIAVGLRRWRRADATEPGQASTGSRGESPASKRLDEDLSRYEL